MESNAPVLLAHVSPKAIAATAVAPLDSALLAISICRVAGSLGSRKQVYFKMIGSPGKGSNLTACVSLVDARGPGKGWSKRRPWVQACIPASIALSRGRR